MFQYCGRVREGRPLPVSYFSPAVGEEAGQAARDGGIGRVCRFFCCAVRGRCAGTLPHDDGNCLDCRLCQRLSRRGYSNELVCRDFL